MDIRIEPINFPTKNLWETNIKKDYQFINSIEEVVKLIKENNLTHFEVKEKFIPGDKITNILDNTASKNSFIFNYTDDTHNLAISSKYVNIINPKFYKKYEKEIKKAFVEQAKSTSKSYYHINKYNFSDELLNELIKKENISLYFEDVKLTDKQLQKIKDNFLNAFARFDGVQTKISDIYAYSCYTKNMLADMDTISIYKNNLLEDNILNLRYLKENASINISLTDNLMTEEEKLTLIKDNLIKLESLNKKYMVTFSLNERGIFNKLFKDLKFNNLDLIIDNDYYNYSMEEYNYEEEKLELLVKDIIDKDLSPFEKFIAVYNIVKNIKPYKENLENREEARRLKYILDNDYIVCVGYAKLLVELLRKVGINATDYSLNADISYDDGFTLEEKIIELAAHKRVIVNIDDDKYNIHGLYLSDPTWDNDLEKNYLNNAIMTFDKMQVNNRMFEYDIYNPILDIHNFKEYNEQVNFLLKRNIQKLNDIKTYKDNPLQKILDAYKKTGVSILQTIKCDLKYQEFFNKLRSCHNEEDYLNFYTELGHYLLTRINKPIIDRYLFKASIEVVNKLNLKNNLSKDKIEYHKRDVIQFPYKIPEDNDFMLENRKKI